VSFIEPAARELADLGAAMRDWDRRDLLDAMLAAKNAGWSFEQVFREVVRLLLREDGDPAGLRHASRHPFRNADIPSEDVAAWAAKAREGLQHHPADLGETA
jgi:hypothetical protein